MKQFEPECSDGTLSLCHDETEVTIGTLDDIVAAVGGETYEIEYDDAQRMQPWLDTDDGVLEIDVRDAVTTMTHTEEFVAELTEYDMKTDRYGLPTRTVEFADRFVDILEKQGVES